MISKYTQTNGLTVLLEPIESSASVSIGIWIKAGSRNETKEEYGYAHLVEHMLFKGTSQRSAKELARLVDRVGGQHNAATNREYTCYYISIAAEHLELALNILSDMYYNSLFDPEELAKEKNVVIEEIKMYEDTPDEYIHDVFMEKMQTGHPLGHSILGTREGISKSTRENLTGFFAKHYAPNNTVASIAGNFIPEEAKALIEKYFGKTVNRNANESAEELFETDIMGEVHIDRDLEQTHFIMGLPGLKRNDDDRWAMLALSTILGGSMSSKLFQKVREDEGLCYSIYSFNSSFSDAGTFGIYCATSQEKFKKAVNIIADECRQLLNNGVTQEELDDAKTFLKGNLALNFESNEVRMGQLAKNEMIYGKYFTFSEIVDQINSVKNEDFARVCRRLFENKRMSIISLGKLKNTDKNNLKLQF